MQCSIGQYVQKMFFKLSIAHKFPHHLKDKSTKDKSWRVTYQYWILHTLEQYSGINGGFYYAKFSFYCERNLQIACILAIVLRIAYFRREYYVFQHKKLYC